MSVRGELTAWAWDPVPTIGVVLAGVGYALALRRLSGRTGRSTWPRSRTAAFAVGLLALLLAADGPPDALAGTSFAAHMVQHLLIQLAAAPLLVLGAPVTVLLRGDPPWLPRRMLRRALRSRAAHLIARPTVTFAAFAAVLVGSHLTPLYELTLRDGAVHQLEHAAYLLTACLFWWPVIGPDPGPAKPGHPARVLYLLLIMPVMALLGVAIAGSGEILYPHYAAHLPPWGATALQDQHAAGTLMWISGMITIPPALVLVLLRWLDQDERDTARRSGPVARHRDGVVEGSAAS